jgi:nucleotide-binding universal stress UspA family protein
MEPSLIVHPVSYSSSGQTALATAVALARLSGADLHVLEVTGRRRSSRHPIVRPITDADVDPHFAEFAQSVNSADVTIRAVEVVGDIVDAVVAYAQSTSADLVVVADQARSHGPYWRRGRYASDLARQLSIPLVSVPASPDERLAGERPSCEAAKSHAEAIALIIGQSTGAQASGDVVVARVGARHEVSMVSPLRRALRNARRPVLVVPATWTPRVRGDLSFHAHADAHRPRNGRGAETRAAPCEFFSTPDSQTRISLRI